MFSATHSGSESSVASVPMRTAEGSAAVSVVAVLPVVDSPPEVWPPLLPQPARPTETASSAASTSSTRRFRVMRPPYRIGLGLDRDSSR